MVFYKILRQIYIYIYIITGPGVEAEIDAACQQREEARRCLRSSPQISKASEGSQRYCLELLLGLPP